MAKLVPKPAAVVSAPRRKLLIVGICLFVGGLHFVTGENYDGPFPAFVSGYLIDILLPFAMYLLLGVQNLKSLQKKPLRVFLVFGVGAVSETLQYFGIPLFGRTFDPLDYVMFLVGIAGAVMFESLVLSRLAS
ncbi:MAG: hypothetical protein HKN13_01020 [Rhodothermales bacterium]|nr:hypothetical protein [Rhodothermales bacterium]